MKDILTPELVSVIVLAVAGFIAKTALKIVSTYLQHKINNNKIDRGIATAENAISTAVIKVAQTYVDTVKKSGYFDENSQKQAFNEAKDLALKLMTEDTKNAINELHGNLNTWIDAKIENAVKWNK